MFQESGLTDCPFLLDHYNTNEDIRNYFDSWDTKELPASKRGSFIPSDLISGKSIASPPRKLEVASAKKLKPVSKTIFPRDFKVRFGSDRLVDIRGELIRMKREDYPNAGAVLLRVFFELAVVDYLDRCGELTKIIEKLGGKGKLQHGTPTLKQLVPEITRIAKSRLSTADAAKVEKAIRYDPSAPFTISDLHSFIHSSDLPSERDILQFWLRTEPLFRLMLEQDLQDGGE